MLQNEIERTQEWWKDKAFTSEPDHRYQSLENGTDKGYTPQELEISVSKLRKKKGMANVPAHCTILSSRAQKEITEAWNWYEDRQRGPGDRFLMPTS